MSHTVVVTSPSRSKIPFRDVDEIFLAFLSFLRTRDRMGQDLQNTQFSLLNSPPLLSIFDES